MHQALYIADAVSPEALQWASGLTHLLGRELQVASDWEALEDQDILFICCDCSKRRVQHWLDRCRDLRIPYVLLTPTMRKLPLLAKSGTLRELLVPVTMLEEETYKAELVSHLARYTHAHINIMCAGDYGSRAKTNADRIATFLNGALGIDLHETIRRAQSGSDKLYKETPQLVRQTTADCTIWTASRDYGLDDILFGPAERYIVLHSEVPVFLLNPRGDLYSLCD